MAKRLPIGLVASLLLTACASLKIEPMSTLVPTVSIVSTSSPMTVDAPRPTSALRPTVDGRNTVPPGFVTPEVLLDPTTGWHRYDNNRFGVSIQFPPDWRGPDVYQTNAGLRIEVGSDIVYPYGTDSLDRVYGLKNSYYVTIQYSLNINHLDRGQYIKNSPWMQEYLSLRDLKDGESVSSLRALVIRVRPVELGRFKGLEYIETLSDTAKTEWYYVRYIVLFDEELNNLTITGSPNNVQVLDRANWRDAYRNVDEANLATLHKILQLTSIK